MSLKYKDKLSRGIETYKELQKVISNSGIQNKFLIENAVTYSNQFLGSLEKMSKIVSRLENLNHQVIEAEKRMFDLINLIKNYEEGLFDEKHRI